MKNATITTVSENESMGGLRSYFSARVWVLVLSLLGLAAVPFFVPPSVGLSAGLTIEAYILLVGAVELTAALGIAAVVIYHHDGDREESEWRFEP